MGISAVSVKVMGFGAVVATAAAPSLNSVSVPFIGVPLTALFMACAGALCSMAWTQGEVSRGKLIMTTTASTFVAAACVSVIPQAFHREWPPALQSPLALLFGLLIPWVVPAMKGAIPAFFKALSDTIVRVMTEKVTLNGGAGYDSGYKPRPYNGSDPQGDE